MGKFARRDNPYRTGSLAALTVEELCELDRVLGVKVPDVAVTDEPPIQSVGTVVVNDDRIVRLERLVQDLAGEVAALIGQLETFRETKAPVIHVNVPEQPAPRVDVHVPEQPAPTVTVNVPEPKKRKVTKRVVHDAEGKIVRVDETEE